MKNVAFVASTTERYVKIIQVTADIKHQGEYITPKAVKPAAKQQQTKASIARLRR